jgi:hypothetical protein
MNLHRSLIGFSAAVALLACSASSYAGIEASAAPHAVPVSPNLRAPVVPSAQRGPGQAQIDEAVRCLNQAALQWDFASNADVLALLRRAQDRLVAAAKLQDGQLRMRTDDLLADLNRAIERASTQLGTLSSPNGETFGPQAPGRNDLAQLASEGQDLERGAPLVHRLLLTVDVGSQDRQVSPAHTDRGGRFRACELRPAVVAARTAVAMASSALPILMCKAGPAQAADPVATAGTL